MQLKQLKLINNLLTLTNNCSTQHDKNCRISHENVYGVETAKMHEMQVSDLSVALSLGNWHLWVNPTPPAAAIFTVLSMTEFSSADTTFHALQACLTSLYPL